MSNPTYTPSAFRPDAQAPAPALWRELLSATPLALLLQSLKAPAKAH